MSAAVTPPPAREPRPDPVALRRVGPSERLSATTALSLIFFGVLILGVGFSLDDAAPVVPTLDVILTQTSTPETPKDADFIAQANNRGGGDRDKAQRPSDNQYSPVPKPQPGIAPQPLTAQAPPPAPEPHQRLLTTAGQSALKVPLPEEHPDSTPSLLPTGDEMIQRSMAMARQSQILELRRQLYAKRPKKKFITASTKEYEYAAYMHAWVQKVERIGNLNYPEVARRQGFGGRLIMTVSIGRNGDVRGVLINTSSGRKVLDEAAVRVVELASPFPPLPKTAEAVDILEITRTWDFKNGSVATE